MGETATAIGLRQPADRASVVGQSDDELIAGVRGSDTAAFEEIYDRYARGILAFCAHMLGSREAAEDALQLTFVSAYRALRSGQNSIALRPWLYTIARNRCLSELRARRDAIGVDELTTDHQVFEGLADQVQRREDLREMLDDMQRLPADQRAALVLFELGDHPQKDIASVLGVRTEKVKALVFQAREALVRGRQARQHPCGDIREQLATMEGRIPARSLLRAHIDRCAGCQSFEHEVRHQRAALAVILPVALAGELKSSILGSALHSGAVAAACGGGGGAVAASACGGSAVVGGATTVGGVSAIGGATAVSGVGGGLGAVSATTAGGLASAGAGAVATSAPVVAAATGLTAIGESIGVGGLSASGVVAKILTAAAIATVAASTGHSDRPFAHRATAPPTTRERLLASVPARSAPRAPAPFEHPPATTLPAPGTVSSTTLGAQGPASTTPTTSGGATSTQTASPGSAATGGSTAPATAGGTGSTTPPATTDPSASTTPSGTSSPTTTGSATAAPTSTPVSDPTGSATSTAPAASAPADTAAADPSSTSTDSTSAPADSTDAASSTGSAPSAPATESSAAGSAAADTGSASSGTAGDSGAAAAPSTSAVDQSSSSPSAAAGSAAQANVSQAAAAPAQTDATVASG